MKGFFKDTIPAVAAQIKSISFLRLDGDLYRSTRDALELLYFKIIANGLIYVDDYGSSAPIWSYATHKTIIVVQLLKVPMPTIDSQISASYILHVCSVYVWIK